MTNGEVGHYVALSYCWGPPEKHPLRTTKDNLPYHRNVIAFQTMPKVFQDAIIITRELGIRYVWIDSLCVVQDSEEDWRQESGNMGLIYERARLTIAASGAEDPSQGCFLICPAKCVPTIKMPYIPDSGEISGSVHVALAPRAYRNVSPAYGPLRQRAWATQERKLSRRVVHYMPGGMSWKCRQSSRIYSEDGNSYHDAEDSHWYSFIQSYSSTELTYESDRFIAIQGIVNEMQKTREDKYFAGMWTRDLSKALLWMAEKKSARNTSLENVPSWSWASIIGKVNWSTKALELHEACTDLVLEGSGKILVTGLSKYIRCNKGIRKGHMQQLDRLLLFNFIQRFTSAPVYIIENSGATSEREYLGWAVFDCENLPVQAYCLCLMSWSPDWSNYKGKLFYFVLLLEPTSFNADTYRRVGMGLILDGRWLAGEVPRTFGII